MAPASVRMELAFEFWFSYIGIFYARVQGMHDAHNNKYSAYSSRNSGNLDTADLKRGRKPKFAFKSKAAWPLPWLRMSVAFIECSCPDFLQYRELTIAVRWSSASHVIKANIVWR